MCSQFSIANDFGTFLWWCLMNRSLKLNVIELIIFLLVHFVSHLKFFPTREQKEQQDKPFKPIQPFLSPMALEMFS